MAKVYGTDHTGFGSVERFAKQNVTKIFNKTQTVICLDFCVLRGSLHGVEEGSTYYQYCTTGVETIEETVMPMALLKTCGVVTVKNIFLIITKKDDMNYE